MIYANGAAGNFCTKCDPFHNVSHSNCRPQHQHTHHHQRQHHYQRQQHYHARIITTASTITIASNITNASNITITTPESSPLPPLSPSPATSPSPRQNHHQRQHHHHRSCHYYHQQPRHHRCHRLHHDSFIKNSKIVLLSSRKKSNPGKTNSDLKRYLQKRIQRGNKFSFFAQNLSPKIFSILYPKNRWYRRRLLLQN